MTVDPSLSDELIVVPVLDQTASIEDEDSVGGLGRGEAMGDRDHGSVAGETVESTTDSDFGGRVDG